MVKNDHTHPNVQIDIKVKESLEMMKGKAASSVTPMPSLYEEGLIEMRDGAWNDESKALIASMPTYQSARNLLYRARRTVLPPLPLRRQDLVIPDTYETTCSGDPFLLIDGFATIDNLGYLCDANTIFGDGTFYVSPAIFHQLYTLHGLINGNMFPLVFFFLPDKREETYTRMFRLLSDTATTRGFHLNPQKIRTNKQPSGRMAFQTQTFNRQGSPEHVRDDRVPV